MSIDLVLSEFGLSHAQYRKIYPDTPISPSLALDIIDARDVDGYNNKEIKRIWNLSDSQLHYALYNDNAIKAKDTSMVLPRERVEQALKEAKGNFSQTNIAEENGVSQSYVHKVAKELGLLCNRKKRVVLTAEQWHEIEVKSYTTPIERLAKQYGVSRDTIYKALRGNS